MASVNKVILIGNLCSDPTTRYLSNGDAVTNVTIATSETWKGKDGEKHEKTEFHRVTFYRKLAEIAGEYLKKGNLVYVEGKLQTEKWTKDGVDRYTTKVVASEMKMLGSKKTDSYQDQPNESEKNQNNDSSGFADYDDGGNIPF